MEKHPWERPRRPPRPCGSWQKTSLASGMNRLRRQLRATNAIKSKHLFPQKREWLSDHNGRERAQAKCSIHRYDSDLARHLQSLGRNCPCVWAVKSCKDVPKAPSFELTMVRDPVARLELQPWLTQHELGSRRAAFCLRRPPAWASHMRRTATSGRVPGRHEERDRCACRLQASGINRLYIFFLLPCSMITHTHPVSL